MCENEEKKRKSWASSSYLRLPSCRHRSGCSEANLGELIVYRLSVVIKSWSLKIENKSWGFVKTWQIYWRRYSFIIFSSLHSLSWGENLKILLRFELFKFWIPFLEPKDIMNTNCVSTSLSRASRVTKCCLELIPRSPCQNCLCMFRFNIRRGTNTKLSAGRVSMKLLNLIPGK